jgi:hypothetical protein
VFTGAAGATGAGGLLAKARAVRRVRNVIDREKKEGRWEGGGIDKKNVMQSAAKHLYCATNQI